MASTIAHDIDEEWLLISDGNKNVAIQFQQQGTAEVHVSDQGDPDETSAGITISNEITGLPSHFSAAALGDGVKVWARSAEGAEIVVLAY